MPPVSPQDPIPHLAAMVYMASEPFTQRAPIMGIVQGCSAH